MLGRCGSTISRECWLRSGAVDRLGQIPDAVRLSEQPSEAEDQPTPGH